MKITALICVAAMVPLLTIAACGQKGALYLPPRNGTVVTRPAGATAPPSNTSTPAAAPDKKKDEATSQPPKRN